MARQKTIKPDEKAQKRELTNAIRPMRVDVLPEDIKKGKPLDPKQCAVAQAIKRVLGNGEIDVEVHRGVTYVKRGKQGWIRYKTSSGMRLETIVFDRGGQFISGEYDLQPMPLQLPKPKKKSPSRSRSPRSAELAVRRRSIPGVRKSARVKFEPEGDE